MKKLKMSKGVTLTFEEGCNKYLEKCRQRNLREGTIEHYRQSYVQLYKFFDPKMPIEDIDEQSYKDYVLHLKSALDYIASRTESFLFPCRYLKSIILISFSNVFSASSQKVMRDDSSILIGAKESVSVKK